MQKHCTFTHFQEKNPLNLNLPQWMMTERWNSLLSLTGPSFPQPLFKSTFSHVTFIFCHCLCPPLLEGANIVEWVSMTTVDGWSHFFLLTWACPKESDVEPFTLRISIFLYKGSALILHKGACSLCTHSGVVSTKGLLPPIKVRENSRGLKRIESKTSSPRVSPEMTWEYVPTPYFDSWMTALHWGIIVHHHCYLIPVLHIICADRWEISIIFYTSINRQSTICQISHYVNCRFN